MPTIFRARVEALSEGEADALTRIGDQTFDICQNSHIPSALLACHGVNDIGAYLPAVWRKTVIKASADRTVVFALPLEALSDAQGHQPALRRREGEAGL